MNQPDLFDLTFEVLRQSLSFSGDESSQDVAALERAMGKRLSDLACAAAEGELSEIQVKKKVVAERFSRISSVYETAVAQVSAAKHSLEHKGIAHLQALRQRLQTQQANADRRLQDLVLELIGEYGKSMLRGRQREAQLVSSAQQQRLLRTWQLTWQRFAHRLQYDLMLLQHLQGVSVQALVPAAHGAELAALLRRLSRRIGLLSEQAHQPVGVVRISSNRSPAKGAGVFVLAHTSEEVASALTAISAQMSVATAAPAAARSRSPSKGRRAAQVPRTALLSNEGIAHLCLGNNPSPNPGGSALARTPSTSATLTLSPCERFAAQYEDLQGAQLYSQRVFVCLEQLRLLPEGLTQGQGEGDLRASYLHLQDLYANRAVTSLPQLLLLLRGDLLRVSSCSRRDHHQVPSSSSSSSSRRGAQGAQLSSFPEVICCEAADGQQVLHFAPACVLHLLGIGAQLSEEHTTGIASGEEVRGDRLMLFNMMWIPSRQRQQGYGDRDGGHRDRGDGDGSGSSSLAEVMESCLRPPSATAIVPIASAHIPVAVPEDTGICDGDHVKQMVPILSEEVLRALLMHYHRMDPSLPIAPTDISSTWSCLPLLPDSACSSYSRSGRYSHRYALLDQHPVGSGSGSCYYLVQLHPLGGAESGSRPSTSRSRGGVQGGGGAADLLTAAVTAAYHDSAVGSCVVQGGAAVAADSSTPSVVSAAGAGGWDRKVLGGFCLWRSCCSTSSPTSSSLLCGYHSQLQGFLDQRLPGGANAKGGGAESSKYLPKKPPTFSADTAVPVGRQDLLTIRAASTLLQELWDGRLAGTLRMFHKKVVAEAKQRAHLAGRLGNPQTARWLQTVLQTDANQLTNMVMQQPSWAVWRRGDGELWRSMVAQQDDSLALLRDILRAEQMTRAEITALAQLMVFPAQEVGMARKDLRALRDRQEASLLDDAGGGAGGGGAGDYGSLIDLLRDELLICERKLGLLAERRAAEEELRAQHSRRLARARAAEEQQSLNRDPASFRNQGGHW